jgi:lysophospholipase L1-like esterase
LSEATARNTLLFLGDSLTEFFDWEGRFPEHEVHNLGVAGETVQGLLRRLVRVVSYPVSPDVVFVMTGANNVAIEDFSIVGCYRGIVEGIRSAFPGARVVVQSVLPVDFSWVDNRVIQRINTSLREIAGELGAEYLDVFALFADSRGRPIEGYLLDDGVHISDKGYAVWADAVARFLAQRDPEAGEYRRN